MVTKNFELITIHPHKFYNFKCGDYVYFNSFRYMFLGYCDKKECILANDIGEKIKVYLSEIY